MYLSKEAVNEDGFGLSEAIAPEDSLEIVGRVPAGVKYDHPIGCHQINPQRASPCGDEVEPEPSREEEENLDEMEKEGGGGGYK